MATELEGGVMRMLTIYDLYGSRTLSLEEVAAAVEQATGVQLGLRDSYAMGGAYFRAGESGTEEFTVHLNRDEDPEPLEPDFSSHRTLFRIDRSGHADELRRLLEPIADLDFLRRKTRPNGRICVARFQPPGAQARFKAWALENDECFGPKDKWQIEIGRAVGGDFVAVWVQETYAQGQDQGYS